MVVHAHLPCMNANGRKRKRPGNATVYHTHEPIERRNH